MKYKILLFVLASLMVALNGEAQDFWETLPFPDTLDISCVAVNDQGHIFVGTGTTGPCVSDGVYRSTDRGQTWQHVLNTGTISILAIGIDKTGHVYVSSQGATTFWKTTDNGQTWQSIPFNSMCHITKFYSFGNDSLLIGCSQTLGALLLRTYDGGITFDTLFQTYNHVSESVRDIAIEPNGDIYIGLQGWSLGAGGVVRSVDNGATWQYQGLQGYQVINLESNAQGDIFIGAGDDGTFAIYHDNPDEIKFLFWPSNYGMVLNSSGYLYSNSDWPDGTLRSMDNGMTFEWVSNGTLNGPNGELTIDDNDFLYGIFISALPNLYRSKEPTYTGLQSKELAGKTHLMIYPIPAKDILNCRFLQNSIVGEKCKLSIVDINNRILYQEEVLIDSDSYKLNITHLPPGLYCINFTSNQEIVTAKFVKL